MKKGLCLKRRQAGLPLILCLLFALCSLLPALLLTGCPDDSSPETKKITIMFNTDGGSEVASIELDKGDVLPSDYFGTGSKVPTKANNRFIGWKDGGTAVTAATTFNKNTTLTAQWSSSVVITFNTNGGSVVNPIEVDNGGSLPADYLGTGNKTPTKANNRFNGWLNGSTPVTNATKFTQSATLTAQWILRVTVSFSLGEGVEGVPPNPVTIDSGTALGTRFPQQSPFRDGYDFLGWFNGNTEYKSTTVINSTTADFILTAQWEEEEIYEVEYAQNPAIHPGNHFVEIVSGGELTVKAGETFIANGLFSNIEKGAGVLSSKWYCARSATGDGTEINWSQSGSYELSLPFTWVESVPGEYWYWVEVTNYNKNATVQQYSTSKTQNRLKVTVTE